MKNWKQGFLGLLLLSAASVGAQTIDATSSQLKWTGYGIGKSHWGYVNIKDSELKMKDAKPVSGKIVVDLNTIATKDLEGAMADRLNGHLKNEDFFEVEKYPVATFTSTKITPQGKDSYKVEGNLNIKDQTHKETLTMNLVEKDGKKSLEGKLVFDRARYNVKYNSGKFFSAANLGDKLIQDNIDLEIKLVVKE
jgi:polyisoprenoid-binding protein YceI